MKKQTVLRENPENRLLISICCESFSFFTPEAKILKTGVFHKFGSCMQTKTGGWYLRKMPLKNEKPWNLKGTEKVCFSQWKSIPFQCPCYAGVSIPHLLHLLYAGLTTRSSLQVWNPA